MPRDRDYLKDLAETTYDLMTKTDVLDPSAEEIAYAYFPNKQLGGETIEGVRKRLPKIRQILKEVYSLDVYLVSDTYYRRFKRKVPTESELARLCLPLGYGKGAAGVRRHSGDDDLIWDAVIAQSVNSGGSKVKIGANRVLDAVESKEISEDHGSRLLVDAGKVVQPNRPELAAALVQRSVKSGEAQRELPLSQDEEIVIDEREM
jgi:hypothetical protein